MGLRTIVDKRLYILCFTIFAATILFDVCWVHSLSLTFGQSCPLTGVTAGLGINMRYGIQAAFQQINDNGGVNGHTLELVTLDDGYDPGPCLDNTKQFLQNSTIFGLIGYVGTSSSQTVIPYTVNASVPFIGPLTGGATIRYPFRKPVFNIRASYADETAAMVNFLINTLQKRRISIMYQDDAFGYSGYDGLVNALRGVKVPLRSEGKFPRNTLAVEGLVSTIATGKPDAVVLIATYAAAGKFIRLARASGLYNSDITFFTGSFVSSALFAEEIGEDYRNIYVTQIVPSPESISMKAVRDFRDAMTQYFPGVPLDYVCLEGYLSANFVIEVLRRLAVFTRDNFIASVYDVGEYFFGGLKYGPFRDSCSDSGDCECNQGLRSVWMTQLSANHTYSIIPSGYWSWSTCLSDPTSIKTPIIFGQSAPLTGSLEFVGNSMRAGILSAFTEYNELGGYNGRVLQLISLDDMYDPAKTMNNTIDFLQREGVFGLIGYVGTATTLGSLDMIRTANIPLIGPYSGSRLLRSPFSELKNVINVRASYDDEVAAVVNYLITYKMVFRIGVLYQNDTFGKSTLDGLMKASNSLGVSVVALGTYLRRTLDVENAVDSILASKPEAIVLIGQAKPLAKFIRLVRYSGVENADRIIFATISFAGSTNFSKLLLADGTTSEVFMTEAVPYPFDSNIPTIMKFMEQLNKTSPDTAVSSTSLEGYLAGKLVANVLSEMALLSTPLTASNFISSLYTISSFSFGGVTLGSYIDGCSSLGVAAPAKVKISSLLIGTYRPPDMSSTTRSIMNCCNQGMREVIMVNISSSGAFQLIPEGRLSHPLTCNLNVDSLKAPITFGSDAPIDPDSSQVQFHQGVLASFSIVNSAGGLNGRRLNLKFYSDNGTDASYMSNLATMFSQDKIEGIIGTRKSAPFEEIQSLTNGTFPIIAPQTGSSRIRNSYVKNFIHVRPSLKDEAASIATLLTNFFTFSGSIVVYVQPNDPYWIEAFNAFSKYMRTVLRKSFHYEYIDESTFSARRITDSLESHKKKAVVIFASDDVIIAACKHELISSDDSKIVLPYDVHLEHIISEVIHSLNYSDSTFMRSRMIVSTSFSEARLMEKNPELYRAYYFQMKDSGVPLTIHAFDGFMTGLLIIDVLSRDSTSSSLLDNLYSSGAFSIGGHTLGPIGQKCESINAQCASIAFCSCNQLARQVFLLSVNDPANLDYQSLYTFDFKTCGVIFPVAKINYTPLIIVLVIAFAILVFIMIVAAIGVCQYSKLKETMYAPKSGNLVVAFTDVQSSTKLWQKNPKEMEKALKVHNQTMRILINRYEGFEIKTQGDSFMVAFSSPENALNWACSVQLALLDQDWSTQLVSMYDCRIQFDRHKRLIYKGLRVRIGLHFGEAQRILDPVTRRPDYFGTTVNKAARCEGEAKGGQVLITEEFFQQVAHLLQFEEDDTTDDTPSIISSPSHSSTPSGKKRRRTKSGKDILYRRGSMGGFSEDSDSTNLNTSEDYVSCRLLGTFQLKGLTERAILYEVMPSSLKLRTFDNSKDSDLQARIDEFVDNNLAIEHDHLLAKKLSQNQVVPATEHFSSDNPYYLTLEVTPQNDGHPVASTNSLEEHNQEEF